MAAVELEYMNLESISSFSRNRSVKSPPRLAIREACLTLSSTDSSGKSLEENSRSCGLEHLINKSNVNKDSLVDQRRTQPRNWMRVPAVDLYDGRSIPIGRTIKTSFTIWSHTENDRPDHPRVANELAPTTTDLNHEQ